MKTVATIGFHTSMELAKKILSEIGKRASETTVGSQTVTLEKSSSEYSQLISLLKNNGINFSERFRNIFSRNDILSAEFCLMHPGRYYGYPQPENDYKSASYDTSQGCRKCCNGMPQDRPLRLSSVPKDSKFDIFALHWVYEHIVSNRLKGMFEEEEFTGCSFWSVINHKTGQPLKSYYQLRIDSVLPPMSERTTFQAITDVGNHGCGYLGRNLAAASQAVYSRAAMLNARDFNKTWEWLGGGHGTTQLPIVSKKVCTFFLTKKVRDVPIFEPVIIEG